MTPARYKECQKGMLQLTQEEIDEGWHYCLEWDVMPSRLARSKSLWM